ncbi:MAG: LysR family transcriptional regulator [Telmatospirillum sp.]|nr:LysR family transcriptional regulator [Telmatospirillum sp.]
MFDPVLLQTFVVAAQTHSFTEAGRRLGLGQPTVSQHIRRLEDKAGRRLFVRDTHRVDLTVDGEAMLTLAQGILDANERAVRHFAGSELRGRLRFGASEDFVQSRLPEVLRDFVNRHPSVDMELTVALSGVLYELLDAGQLDLVLAKRRLGDDRGELVRRARLVWIGREPVRIAPGRPVPLVMFPPPSITRAMAIEALERAGLGWRIVCTCGGLAGLRAGALAGFGLMVQPQSMIPPGLVEIRSHHLPGPGEIEFVLVGGARVLRGAAAELASVIRNSDDRLQSA